MKTTGIASLYSFLRLAALTAVVLGGDWPAIAGTQGAYMNSAGFGKAADSIVYGGRTNKAVTKIAGLGPCAAVNPQNFTCSADNIVKELPPGTPSTVFCQSIGASNYRWSIKAYVTGGATADNPELEARLPINASECASYSLESQASLTDAYSGAITVNATATAGAAIWLRGFEFPGTPADLEDLLANGTLKFDLLVAGPFDFSTADCTAMNIPFTTQTGHENLYFVADGVAKSFPFEIYCPENVTFGCSDALVYPAVQASGGCGNVTVSYNPPATSLPTGVTPVTVTATDEAGNTAQCTFLATRRALTFDGFFPPICGTGGSATSPRATFNRGCVIPVKFKTLCNRVPFVTGTPTLSIRRCPSTPVGGGNFQMVANQWHFNWNTRGLSAGTYELIATLQDGSQQRVFIKLR